MIELAEVISELRRELQEALTAGADAPLRFELGPVELEATVTVERGTSGSGRVRFWVVELGGEGSVSHGATQRLKLVFQPTMAGRPAVITGPEVQHER